MLRAGPDLSGVSLPVMNYSSQVKSRNRRIIQTVRIRDVVLPDGLDFLDKVGQSIPNM